MDQLLHQQFGRCRWCNYGGTTISFSGTNYFINNSASCGGAISTSAAIVSFTGTDKFINNIAYSCGGGAIFSSENNALVFNRTVKLTKNACGSGSESILGGGGLYMGLKSTFSILPNECVLGEQSCKFRRSYLCSRC